jgi:hypothetical protein
MTPFPAGHLFFRYFLLFSTFSADLPVRAGA